ncbi:MAG: hypothetical protein AB1679_17335 [Actinomycetota bacterium]|jgi:hypothetical protein
MVDYQFLGMVAVVTAVVTRGSLLPVLALTALIAVVMVAYEAGARRYRRRHAGGPASSATPSPTPTDTELTRWMTVVDRVLRSND